MVGVGGGLDGAVGDDRAEVTVLGDLPGHLDGGAEPRAGHGVGGGRDTGPQQDPVGQRVARGDAVQEGGPGGGCGGGARDEGSRAAAAAAAVTALRRDMWRSVTAEEITDK
ncbi:hypothetical protein SVIO_034730 [Streptomyces violaceusniger]|uniref:Uncharacterized protein n=1 Tax=Streptomyces violaceusniger TaxID=68280 RepID=A0A4D4L1V0_STRVO|nr:hypothetical protein SVIO_034730 [Streptomyces violaceusniger]